MSDLDTGLITVGDLFRTATELRADVAGHAGNRTRGIGGEWRARVVGIDPESHSQVTVASYDHLYEKKSDATRRSRQLLKFLSKIAKDNRRSLTSSRKRDNAYDPLDHLSDWTLDALEVRAAQTQDPRVLAEIDRRGRTKRG